MEAGVNRPSGSFAKIATPIKAWAQRFAVLLLISASFSLMLLGKADVAMIERARTAVSDAVAPVLDAASRPVATVADVLREGKELAALRAENKALRRENARLEHWRTVAHRLEAENRALGKLLNLAPEPDTRYVTGRVVADSGGAFARSVLINAGEKQDIGKGQAAMTGDGLAGRVAEVGRTSARILLITDINSRIPVVIQSTREKAILAGDNSDMPRLRYLPGDAAVSRGQRVVTSGHGGVFPPGLPVGRVVKVSESDIRVRPLVDWNRMEYLRVVDYGMSGILMTEPAPAEQTAAASGDGT
jgi:rod shape-determining protein MreC